MKFKALAAFRRKFLMPCKKLITVFKFRLKKPVFIRAIPSRTFRNTRIDSVLPIFRSSQKYKSMERRNEARSPSCRTENETLIYPSPNTAANIRQRKLNRKQSSSHDDVEDACRRFENYLLVMISEDGKMKDLTDVEEFLCCWKNLKCPVFIDLVCRFYGELCKELFSSNNDEDCISRIGC